MKAPRLVATAEVVLTITEPDTGREVVLRGKKVVRVAGGTVGPVATAALTGVVESMKEAVWLVQPR